MPVRGIAFRGGRDKTYSHFVLSKPPINGKEVSLCELDKTYAHSLLGI